jgi:hypothetical protein
MQITLSSEEAGLLHDLLQDYLPTLQREVARTEAKELRHLLVRRQELVERLLPQLASAGHIAHAG